MGLSGPAHGKNLKFSLDTQAGVLKDISAYVKSVKGPIKRSKSDASAAGAAGSSNLLGLHSATITLECKFDDAVDSAWDVVKDWLTDTATRSWAYGPAGSTSGFMKKSGECRISEVGTPADIEGTLYFTIVLETDGTITIGTWT